MKVEGKVAVVTGGGSGIGRALVVELVGQGARVYTVDKDGEGLEETRRLAGGDAVAIDTLDVTNRSGVYELPARVIERFGAVDALINNAGVAHPRAGIEELDEELIHLVMDINFFGTLHLTRAFIPHLKTRPEAHIANISSLVALNATAGQIMYASSKGAIKSFTQALALDLAETSVGVTLVLPGVVRSNFIENSGLQSAPGEEPVDAKIPQMDADEAAAKIVKGIERNNERLLVGGDVRFVDALARVSPTLTSKLLARVAKSLLPD